MYWYTYSKMNKKMLIILICGIILGISDATQSFYKFPVYWKSVNKSSDNFKTGRFLRDYLSMVPTYGDSKGLGSII